MLALCELLAVNVPRYTSYPTAPHFHSGVGAEDYRCWLAQLSCDSPLSLYLHIPFCDTLCWFCGCNTTIVNRYQPISEYLNLLLREISLLIDSIPGRRPVSHIHWGGGSPTILSIGDIDRLCQSLHQYFDIQTGTEFAIEIDPRGLDLEKVRILAQVGLTRASIGLQDCDNRVQHAINRVQTKEETAQTVEMLRKEGIKNINLDLIYGLPYQTLESWERTLTFALSLNPDRLAVFGYAHVPKFKKHQNLIEQRALPGIEARLSMAQRAQTIICDNGYVAIGLDHFSKPNDSMAMAARAGTLYRNFQGYTTDHAHCLLGLGASSIGSLAQGYVQNQPTVALYRAMVTKGQLPIARGIALNDDDRIRRKVIADLMCQLNVDLQAVAQAWGRDPSMFAASLERLAPLIGLGVVELRGTQIRVPRSWSAALRLVAAVFDDYLSRDKALHSSSV